VVKIATNGISKIFSTKRECFKHGISLPEKIPPKMFSFNSHIGACVKCDGLGIIKTIDPEALIVDKKLSIIEGAIGPISRSSNHVLSLLESVGKKFDFKLDTPLEKFTEEQMNILLYGTQKKLRYQRDVSRKNYSYTYTKDIKFKGLIQQYQEWLRKTTSLYFIRKMEKYTKIQQCPVCKGARLKPTSLAVRVGGLNLEQILECSIKEAYEFFTNLSFGGSKKIVADRIIEEITTRLQFLKNVGLDYLTLNREATTLSGGEAQRIRLATQIGNKLVGVLYVLNEPSIGLHARDIDRLIKTLEELRDLGNTVVIIEHDENTIRNADNIIDLGPGAGVKGGEVVSTGSFKELLENSKSITAKYLNGELTIPLPKTRRRKKGSLLLEGVQHNNLKNINVEFPLGILTCVSGVSGSGKSSLVIEVLYRILAKEYHRAKTLPGKYTKIDGLENLDKVILINQNPIGRSSRSNPATYTGVFDHIRELYANLPESQLRGYTISRYSFNNSEGRCSVCKGKGTKEIEMLFLSNVEITCEECKGKRYNRETLKVKFKGKSIADVLEMTVNDALQFFSNQPKIAEILQIMVDVGIGYMQLGQSASTLSGGEAQRVKLASELCRPQTSRTLYILDEPTVGLSAYDIDKLLQILNRLIEQGNSVIIIEHNLNVIKSADWVIDLGPEGGEAGGEVVIEGTPEDIMKSKKSITGQYLKAFLKQQEKRVKTKEIKELKDTRAEVFEKT
ncbi:MAG: excinuclease ABC subunit UvrA, partial [Asgard group archaeon]|nr:excinuclease ABC subunit UvrA [Asgard group archaeon]